MYGTECNYCGSEMELVRGNKYVCEECGTTDTYDSRDVEEY